MTIADKFLLGVCFTGIAGLIFVGYLGVTYVDPCDKICSPAINVRPAQEICICATAIEIREKK